MEPKSAHFDRPYGTKRFVFLPGVKTPGYSHNVPLGRKPGSNKVGAWERGVSSRARFPRYFCFSRRAFTSSARLDVLIHCAAAA